MSESQDEEEMRRKERAEKFKNRINQMAFDRALRCIEEVKKFGPTVQDFVRKHFNLDMSPGVNDNFAEDELNLSLTLTRFFDHPSSDQETLSKAMKSEIEKLDKIGDIKTIAFRLAAYYFGYLKIENSPEFNDLMEKKDGNGLLLFLMINAPLTEDSDKELYAIIARYV